MSCPQSAAGLITERKGEVVTSIFSGFFEWQAIGSAALELPENLLHAFS